jgi:hypothetical protein
LVDVAFRMLLLAAVACTLRSFGGSSASEQGLRWCIAAVATAASLAADPVGVALARVDGSLLASTCAFARQR